MQTQSNLKLTNRITNKDGNWGRLTLTFKHLDSTHKAGWRWGFTKRFNVKDTNQTRNYIKSSDFQDFLYKEIFKKYEGMTYDEMDKLLQIEKNIDTDKINDKLKDYLYDFNTNTIENDFHIKITKRECLKEGFGIYCGDWFIQGRIYNKDYSGYRTFHYYTAIAPNGVLDLAIDEEMSDEEVDAIEYKFNNNKSYRKKLFNEYIDFDFERFGYLIKSFDDCKGFYEAINATIDGYNRRCA